MYSFSLAEASTSNQVDLVTSVEVLLNAATTGTAEEQRNAANRLNSELTGSVDLEPVIRLFSATGKTKHSHEPTKSLLRALEVADDDVTVILLCRIAEALISDDNQKSAAKRHRRLIRADVCSSLIRALRLRLRSLLTISTDSTVSPVALPIPIVVPISVPSTSSSSFSTRQVATDALAALLLAYGAKDPRLTLKMRVGGILPPLCTLMDTRDTPQASGSVLASPTLLRLLCRAVRSPRNAQLCGRQRDFCLWLMERVSRLSSTDSTDSAHLTALARHLEILYFITKNRKTRIQLIQDGVVSRVVHVVERQLEARKRAAAAGTGRGFGFGFGIGSPPAEGGVTGFGATAQELSASAVHSELCLVALADLRLLANNKKAKSQLISLGALGMCERAIGDLADEMPDQTPTARQLQDSLCALCLRCLPTVEFPLSNVPFPLRFPLPRPTSPARRRSVSKSPMKALRSSSSSLPSTSTSSTASVSPSITSPGKSLFNKSFDEGAMLSSDDDGVDEEDEVFCGLDDSELLRSDGEEEEREAGGKTKKDPVISHSKQRPAELTYYDVMNCEAREGVSATMAVPWTGYSDAIQKACQSTNSVVPFAKIAYPEWAEPDVDQQKQPLALNKDSMKEMVVQQMARSRLRAPFSARVVFDLDDLCSPSAGGVAVVPSSPTKSTRPMMQLNCDDRAKVGKVDKDHLFFESRFESGNLRRATQVGPQHYELILSPDINQVKDHYQWFYFEVSNMKANTPYTFEIVNCLKTTSMYSRGMQPVLYSVRDSMAGRGGWRRAGDAVCYYRNLYTGADDSADAGDEDRTKKRYFYSIRFNLTFQNKGDVCYLAYHFPYTHSYLKATLDRCLSRISPSVYCRSDVIGCSLGGNPVQMLTITAPGTRADVAARDTMVLSARVHPGESNASWMMHGIIEALLCSAEPYVTELLRRFVIKLIPMLNPDGVINGSHRCSLSGVDLNRVWDKPSRLLHPEIYHAKGIIQYLSEVRRRAPWVFVDLHGHSRRSNVFVFGNNPDESYRAADKEMQHDNEFMVLPEVLEQNAPAFSSKNCRFAVARGKESSARVAIWRQFGVARSYTMESTYCGFETGAYRGYQIGTRELKEMGRHLLAGIAESRRLSGSDSPAKSRNSASVAASPTTAPARDMRKKSRTPERSLVATSGGLTAGSPLARQAVAE